MRAARTRVERFEDQTAIVVERFDRTVLDDQLVRVHQEDLCQASGRHPADKYQSDGGPSPAEIANLLRTTIAGRAAEIAVDRFADGLIFNWLIVGTDAHAKNYSLLMSGPQVRFAPLYDISSALPYDDSEGHKLRLAMKVGGTYKLLQTDAARAWARTAAELRIDADRLIGRAMELADRIADAFTDAADAPAVDNLESSMPARLADLVARRADKCRRALSVTVDDP